LLTALDGNCAALGNLTKEANMSIGTILLIILILALIGALPSWPYSREWGYGPSGVTGLIVVVLIVLLVMKVI
jgi:hypothetical protein